MPLGIILLIVQGLAIVHVLRTGREIWWILLIVFLPGIGVLIYCLVEVLPSLVNRSLTARRALRRVRSVVDPERGVREAALEYARNRSVDTASRLSDELTEAGDSDEAIRICNQARTGIFEDDPKLLLSLAKAQFGAQRHPDTIATLQYLREKNPGLHSPEGHLLHARALEASGDTDNALQEYTAVARYYPGAEARVRQALLYKKLGQPDRARELFAQILKDARLAPKHFRKSQREWIERAERENTELQRSGGDPRPT